MHAEVSLSKYDTSSNNRPEIICSVLHTYVTSIQNVVANAFHIWKQRYRPVRIMYIGDTLISCVGLSREGGGDCAGLQNFSWKLRCKWKYNIKVDVNETG